MTVLKLARNANKDGWGNKLVTIFARHRDHFALTINFSHFCQLFAGSGKIRNAGTNYRSPGLAKIAAPVPIPRDGGLPAGTVF